MKIIGSTWYTQMGGRVIGIVIVDNGFEEKAYIGTAPGLIQVEDEAYIASTGARFPLTEAKRLIGSCTC